MGTILQRAVQLVHRKHETGASLLRGSIAQDSAGTAPAIPVRGHLCCMGASGECSGQHPPPCTGAV
jgi:hypothetical protein